MNHRVAPAPCRPETKGATVVECYDTEAVALVASGNRYWRDVVKEDHPALDLTSVAPLVLLSISTALAVRYVRRNK